LVGIIKKIDMSGGNENPKQKPGAGESLHAARKCAGLILLQMIYII
jgi:hypothetical protein